MKISITLLAGIMLSVNAFSQCENWEWAHNASGIQDGFESSMTTDPFGNVYPAGNFDSSYMTIGTDTFYNTGPDSTWDIYLSKYDGNGNYLWGLHGGTNGWDKLSAITTDPSGNVIIIGQYCSCDTFIFSTATLIPHASDPFFIIKTDPSGNILWAKQLSAPTYSFYQGGGISGLCSDANGNLFVSGFFGGDTFVIDTDTLFRNPAITHPLFVAKFDPNGNVLWAQSIYADGEENAILTTDPFGNCYVAASVKNDTVFFGNDVLLNHATSGSRDIVLLKFDSDGNQIWGKIHGGLNDDEPMVITSDNLGNIYFTGYFVSQSMDFDSYTLTQNGNLNMFVVKLKADGHYAWATNSSCSSQAAGFGLAVNSLGECYVHGPYDCQQLSIGSVLMTNNGMWDAFLVKFDQNGNAIWGTSIGNTQTETAGLLSFDPDDNLFLQGHTSSNLLTIGTDTLQYIGNSVYDMFIAKFSKFNISVSANPSHCGQSDGNASVAITGGTAPFSYQWSNGDSTSLIDSISAGIYAITVTDFNDCEAYATVMLSDQDGPSISINNQSDVSCPGNADGALDISITSGSSPYSYAWSNGATTQDISGLAEGPYNVVVTDDNACIAIGNYSISEPDAMSFSVNVQQPTCHNSDGVVSSVVIGGSPPYAYQWSNGGTNPVITGLTAGVYILTVTDNNGCSDSIAVPISDVTGPAIAVDSIVDAGCGANNGSVYVNVTGGQLPYTYQWSNNSSFEDQLSLAAGPYYLTVTDGNGCISSIAVTVNTNPVSDPICLVTVDTSINRNVVVWEKSQSLGIQAYKIYRESTQQGVYQLAGTVPFDSLSIFVDSVADPAVKSWRYKISILDSCNNESVQTAPHKTIHLNINLGIGNTINLIWDAYEGFNFSSYYINRWSQVFGWELIDSVASNVTSYSDQNSPGGNLYYYISVKPPSTCVANRSVNYHSSRSNMPPSVNTGSMQSANKGHRLFVYPNPSRGVFSVHLPENDHPDMYLSIMDIEGRKIYEEHFGNNRGNRYKVVDLSKTRAGMYFLILNNGNAIYTHKIIVQ